MPDQPVATAAQKSPIQAKHVMWVVFVLMALFVLLTRERSLLDPASFLRLRYAPVPFLMFAHGIPAALALVLGVFQFSSRLRQRQLQVHRVLGRIYVASVAIGAPVAVVVALKLPIPSLFMASLVQAGGWVLTTATALYCVRAGKIQQHKEWMMRGYPFAMAFVVNRVILSIPAVQAMGVFGLITVVWSTNAVACFLPSYLIAWQALAASNKAGKKAAGPQKAPV
ncbi:MAG: DUF2306 domain-containing protein [Holophagaceae bacterium]|nr:DUF2306 domain-containing protein [Holophagaceae bacterium]